MTVSSTTSRASHDGDGASTVFSVPFFFLDEADLKVVLADAQGTETIQTLAIDYAVTGAGAPAGGSVVLTVAPAVGQTVVILRDIDALQETDFEENADLPADTLERGFDRLTMLVQQVIESIGRAVLLPTTSTLTGIAFPEPEAGKLLAGNETGNGFVNKTPAESGEVVYPIAIADGGTGAKTAAQALANLGLETVTRSEAEAGAATIERAWTAERVRQAIDALAGGSPRGHVWGLTLASNATDADHDIDIAVGKARDTMDAHDLSLASPLTKRIDAAWSTGTDAGGLFSGTVAADTWYHVFLIRKDVDASVDAGFDTDVSAANIPTGYTAYRRIGSVRTNASANILTFFQHGDRFWWKTVPAVDVDQTNPGTGAVTFTASVPMGVPVVAHLNVMGQRGGNPLALYISSLVAADMAASWSTAPLGSVGPAGASSGSGAFGQVEVLTNTNGQARFRVAASDASTRIVIATVGWIDNRGRE